jgi:soluble lytic murein transglycosylase
MFSGAENAAIAGRIAVSHSRYREALIFFRMVMADAPDLFFRYPELLGDLGRAFQYTSSGSEGIDLFLQWEKNFDEKKLNVDYNQEKLIRFRLLFYAARIARQRVSANQRGGADKAGGADKDGGPDSIQLFERALRWALSLYAETRGGAAISVEQIDACVWYILNSSLAQGSDKAIRYLENNIHNWQDDSYYSDVMDKLARELLMKRKWTDLINIAVLVKNRPGVIGAKFPWIIGRAIQAELLSQRDIGYALKALTSAPLGAMPEASGDPSDVARAYIRIAYNNAAPISDGKALYYRSLSAAALGEEFLTTEKKNINHGVQEEGTEDTEEKKNLITVNSGESETIQFLLGFFKNGAAKFAPRYIRMMESGLSPDDLFRLAEELGKSAPNGSAPNGAGQYQESMRLASILVRRASEPEKRYLELMYPRPFAEQVSQYALETGRGEAKLFGLIRSESAFNPDAISRSGAIGLTQLMPATAEEMAARILRRGGPDYTRRSDKDAAAVGGAAIAGDEISGDTETAAGSGGLIASEVGIDLLDPGANIHMGAVYLAYLEQRLGDPLLAILAYNGGMNRVRRWRNSVPAKFPPDLFLETVEYAETMEYGRAVLGAAAMYRALYQ